MPGFGGKVVRAMLRGANDSAPKGTRFASFEQPGAVADMEIPSVANPAERMEVRSLPQPELTDWYYTTAVKDLPWSKNVPNEARLDAAMQLEDLLAEGDATKLDLFSRQFFGRRWKLAEDHVKEVYKFGETFDDFGPHGDM